MKKKILIGVSSVFVIIVCISLYLWVNKDNETEVYESNKGEKKEIIESNWLSMMYETGPGTGEYSEFKSSLWPESGYIFNDTLSGCENGGELSWNEELGAVTLHSNKSDSCYVYFDMYIIPVINSVTTSNIETDSITLTVNVTNGNNPVTTYYYSNDNGNSYVSSNSNTYTFRGLDMGTEYNFSVYVEDSAGYKSEVYTLEEATQFLPVFYLYIESTDQTLTFNFVENMMWSEWINSDYKIGNFNFQCSNSSDTVLYDGSIDYGYTITNPNYVSVVDGDDLIIANATYYVWNSNYVHLACISV